MTPKHTTTDTTTPAPLFTPPTTFTPPDVAAEYLGVSGWTIRRMLRRGDIPGRKIGGQWRVDPAYFRAPGDGAS